MTTKRIKLKTMIEPVLIQIAFIKLMLEIESYKGKQ